MHALNTSCWRKGHVTLITVNEKCKYSLDWKNCKCECHVDAKAAGDEEARRQSRPDDVS